MPLLLLVACAGDIELARYGWSAVGVFTVTTYTRCDDCWVYENGEPIGMTNEKLIFEEKYDRAFRFGNGDVDEAHSEDGYPLIETGHHGTWVVPEVKPELKASESNHITLQANRYLEGNWTCWDRVEGPVTRDVTMSEGRSFSLPNIDATLTLSGQEMTGVTSDGIETYGTFLDPTTIDISLRQADDTQHTLCWEGEHQDMPRE